MDPVSIFRREGYLVRRSLFSKDDVAQMRSSIDALRDIASVLLEVEHGERSNVAEQKIPFQGSEIVVARRDGVDQIKRVLWAGAAEPSLLRYGRDRRLTRIVESLLGSSTADHLVNQVHFKMPNDGVDDYDWHQDCTHRRYGTAEWRPGIAQRSNAYVQTVIAIDPHTPANGPLRIIPGRYGPLQILKDMEGQPLLPPPWSAADTVSVFLEPGDVAFFHEYLLHKSEPNESAAPRYTLINGFAYPGVNYRKYPGIGSGERITL